MKNIRMTRGAVVGLFVLCAGAIAQETTTVSPDSGRWKICQDRTIVWNIEESVAAGLPLPHRDHLEMSGEQVSCVLRYGVDGERGSELNRSMVWPMLRTVPDNTHASLMIRFDFDIPSGLKVDGKPLGKETVTEMIIPGGELTCHSRFAVENGELEVVHTLFPSMTQPMLCERYTVTNRTDRVISLEVPEVRIENRTEAARGVNGSYTTLVAVQNAGTTTLN
ncbi:MAG: hypothetical protein Q4C47_09530, partial [Planctomycetia bacterium]|nr:hypothetical protein [Planctomycetia bacterium]